MNALEQNSKCNSKYDVLNKITEQYIFRWAKQHIVCSVASQWIQTAQWARIPGMPLYLCGL
jgi:hypothetical protein